MPTRLLRSLWLRLWKWPERRGYVADISLAEALNAISASSQCLRLYIPNKDRNERPLTDLEEIIKQAEEACIILNGGATTHSGLAGIWEDFETRRVKREETTIVYSYVLDPNRFIDNLGQLVAFLHDFGKYGNQGEVFVEFDNEALRLREYIYATKRE